ncbi:sodium/potassium-transporting ATPase subunit beta-2b [Danio rerio]|uniref:Sodium/potassium-transporting ATPase subunit beta n=1 Tax=Danio rerio TaxID=7955 RepID=Q90Z34_DANRE|nr:sodium/potassium-transporting ATPase subunit beta-2b [Danio rerio]AAH64702.1 ATPase, Na+/K+ transporting, beta 2b polypeptide [Danio rerio]AAK54608.1 Na/K-ATPase beta subunit isoform 2b [Danio rerio]|eukprot:NP_571913.1 ATPase Na+/K+ transporting subunit beta 2b [Danio rerio]
MAKDDKNGWKEFFWNPRTREFCGRTASSWGLILLFYLAFYIFLAGLFTLTMYVMLQTLDDHRPTYQDRLSTPGMMIRPKGEQLEIAYTTEYTETWERYVQALNNFLSPYNDTVQTQKNYECKPDQFFIQEDSGGLKNFPKRSCQFKRSILEKCSGITDRFYGYDEGKPCIIIKLNRVIGLLPAKDGQPPYVTCGAKKYKVGKDEWTDDSDKLGELAYYPPNGTFNLMYYPYYGKKAQVNYSQPLVAVKFLNITRNEDVNVECKINSNNIPEGSERDKFAGRVSFTLRINSRD